MALFLSTEHVHKKFVAYFLYCRWKKKMIKIMKGDFLGESHLQSHGTNNCFLLPNIWWLRHSPQGLAIAILQFLDRSILVLIIFSFVQHQSLLIFYLSPSSTNLHNLALVVSQSSVLYPSESFHLSLWTF